MVIPPSMAGPLTLMGWEHAVRWSSWRTLMSTVFPMVLLIWLYHYYCFCYWNNIVSMTRRRQQLKQNNAGVHSTITCTTASPTKRRRPQQQQQLLLRTLQSILILVGTSSPWILTRGSGYLVPLIVKCLAWTELMALSVRLVLIRRETEVTDRSSWPIFFIHPKYKSK
jgi:hypothetical protein